MLAGGLVGLAADIKINYLAFGVGLAWALRRRPAAFLAAAAGGLLVLAPSYAWFGRSAVTALFARRNKSTVDSFYRLLDLSAYRPYLGEVAVAALAALVLLLLWRLPAAEPLRPALRPALALSVGWLVIWPYQLPWYDAMAICLLVLYPASALDWLVVTRLAVATLANMPGNPGKAPGHLLQGTDKFVVHTLAPVVLLTCAALLVLFALTRQWGVTGGADLGRLRRGPPELPRYDEPALSPVPDLAAKWNPLARPPQGVRARGSSGPPGARRPGAGRAGLGWAARALALACRSRGMIMTPPWAASWSP